ncbi:MAG: class I SAM-dependent methyltransferase [Rhodospirillales bacterium]
MDGSANLLDIDRERLAWLVRAVAANRFLPAPPAESADVGDGDFRAIGAEFLYHFVTVGGLRPTDTVLDVGCGAGRMAVPLTQYLDPQAGRYDGVDVVRPAIEWCRQAVTARYGSFAFHHLDLHHPIYNPGGTVQTAGARLPVADASVDFVIMTSLMTHLPAAEMARYAAETARVLRPAGRCFATFFLMNVEARAHLARGAARLPFPPDAAGPEHHASAEVPTSAVAFDEGFVAETFAQAGLVLARPPVYGHWCGRSAAPFQDICLFGKAP